MKYLIVTISSIIILSIILSACSTTKKIQQETSVNTITSTDTATIIATIPSKILNTKEFFINENMLLKASLDIKFPNQNNSISATIEIAELDSILIKISAFLGISVGQLYATPNEFIMNNNLESTTYTGIPTENNIMQVALIPLSYNDLVCILKGIPPQKFSNYKNKTNINIFEFNDENKNELVYTDEINDASIISKLVRKDKNENELFSVEYSNYITISDIKKYFAKKIVIKFPQQNGIIEINYSDIQTKEKPTSPMKFAKPKTYKFKEF